MKVIVLDDGTRIETPWLRGMREAAAYCSVGRSVFCRAAGLLPHRGKGKVRLYHIDTLDAWLSGELPDVPPPGISRKRRLSTAVNRRKAPARSGTLIHPKTRQTYGPRS